MSIDNRPKYVHGYQAFSECKNMLSFDFEVVIRRTVNGTNEKLLQTQKGNGMSSFPDPSQYYPLSNVVKRRKGTKLIPCTEEAMATLAAAHEKIRAASEVLYQFITKDEQDMIEILNQKRLLS